MVEKKKNIKMFHATSVRIIGAVSRTRAETKTLKVNFVARERRCSYYNDMAVA